MRHGDIELHNVHQFLEGDLASLLEGKRQTLSGCADRVADAGGDEGYVISRIPDELRRTLNQSARTNALQATGCEARFNLKGEKARITLKSVDAPSIAEVYQGSFLVSWHVVGTEPTTIEVGRPGNLDLLARVAGEKKLSFDANLTRVAFPWRPICRWLGFEGDVEPPRDGQVPKTRWLAYGSSITHGNLGLRPKGCWAARTAEGLGVDLVNLGFGGGAHLEPQLAEHIAARDDWDFMTLEMGINLIGSIDVEEFARRVEYFVTTIAKAHEDEWIFAIDLFTCRWDFARDPKVERFREVVAERVRQLALPKLVHIRGDELLTDASGLMTDLVHPSPAGMEQIASRLAPRMRAAMG